MHSKTYLIDVDNTLLDSEKLKRTLSQNFKDTFHRESTILWEEYSAILQTHGDFILTELAHALGKRLGLTDISPVENLFLKIQFDECLFPGCLEAVHQLKSSGRVILFSAGDEKYQLHKIRQSGLADVVGNTNIVVKRDKQTYLESLIHELKPNYHSIIIDDDKLCILEEAHRVDRSVVPIHISKGDSTKDAFYPALQFKTFAKAAGQIKKMCGIVIAEATQEAFYIVRDITEVQQKQLIAYSNTDPDIDKFTADRIRFRNEDSLNKWLNGNVTVYSLTDSLENLVGIIWFHEKKLPEKEYSSSFDKTKYKQTIAIRLYGTARGKKISQSFLEKVLSYLDTRNIWISASADNVRGNKIYKNVGFVPVTHPDSNNKIIFVLK